MIIGMCRRYRVLPEAGGLMDQPLWFFRMHAIIVAGGSPEPTSPFDEDDMLAGIPMETL